MIVSEIPTFDDIKSAHARIADKVRWTPLLSSPLLSESLGREVYIKPENLQITGSFKLRGATHKISKLTDGELQNGVVAYSSGNHAQGVAAAAKARGCSADIVMPKDTPQIKIDQTKAWGGRVHFYDRNSESREAIAAKIVAKTSAVLIPPYDDADVICGQATAGYEIIEDCRTRDITPTSVLVPCGGGGLCAGIASAMREGFPDCRIFIGEPQGYDDTLQSLQAGKRLGVSHGSSALCDALLAPMPGELTFPINRKLVEGGFAMNDAEVVEAMAVAFKHFKLIAEPGGAIALAALLKHHNELPTGAVVVVISGGNVDTVVYQKLLSEGL